mmetsp:Transcript_6524/g.10484  ORF Transcript_6524/g.10484 Transcript_6524/m.10484 type:complete len:231 (+) Transcript_6524:120-812(+)
MTCDPNKEKRGIKEAFNLLNDAVEHVYPEMAMKLPGIVAEYEKKKKAEIEERKAKALLGKRKEPEGGVPAEEEPSALKPKTIEEGASAESKEDKPVEHSEPKNETGESKPQEEEKKEEAPAQVAEPLQPPPQREHDLDDEIRELKQNKTRIWFNFDTGTRGVVFIKMHEKVKSTLDVIKLATYIISQVQSADSDSCSRFICRFIPIQMLCKASGNIDQFKKQIRPIIREF